MDLVKCDQCGQEAEVVACTPIAARQPTADNELQPEIGQASCVINCPNCGVRTQVIHV